MEGSSGVRRGLLVAIAVGILAPAPFAAARIQAEASTASPRHAQALDLVLERMFLGESGVTEEAERRTQADPASARAWRVRSVEGSRERFDVIFYIGDRPACVWRVQLKARSVLPDTCSLELWEDPRA